jgi:hypothetical protein
MPNTQCTATTTKNLAAHSININIAISLKLSTVTKALCIHILHSYRTSTQFLIKHDMSLEAGDVALFLLLTLAASIGLLPIFLGWNGLYLSSVGAMVYGAYTLCLPGRMIYRLQPKVPVGSPGYHCILDLFRAWAIFSLALGAMGLAICRENDNKELQRYGNAIFLAVGVVSVAWDRHLMLAKHWEAQGFLLANISVNVAVCLASASELVQLRSR